MSKNIEINYKNSDGSYEILYPNVMLGNIGDFNSYMTNNYYSKGEIDNQVTTINESINNAQMNPGGWKNLGTFNSSTGSGTTYYYSPEINTNITPSINYGYWLVVNFSGYFRGTGVSQSNPMPIQYGCTIRSGTSGNSIGLFGSGYDRNVYQNPFNFTCKAILYVYPIYLYDNTNDNLPQLRLVGVESDQTSYAMDIKANDPISFQTTVSGRYPVTSCGITVSNLTIYRTKINNLSI